MGHELERRFGEEELEEVKSRVVSEGQELEVWVQNVEQHKGGAQKPWFFKAGVTRKKGSSERFPTKIGGSSHNGKRFRGTKVSLNTVY